MNRRNFFGTLLAATAGFTILSGAGRIWKAVRNVPIEWEPNPLYNRAALQIWFLMSENAPINIGPPPANFKEQDYL